jgi:hypothetical protein
MLAIPSLVPPRTLSLVVRKHRRAAELITFPVDDLRLGMGWVMAWLRQRTGESAAGNAPKKTRTATSGKIVHGTPCSRPLRERVFLVPMSATLSSRADYYPVPSGVEEPLWIKNLTDHAETKLPHEDMPVGLPALMA